MAEPIDNLIEELRATGRPPLIDRVGTVQPPDLWDAAYARLATI